MNFFFIFNFCANFFRFTVQVLLRVCILCSIDNHLHSMASEMDGTASSQAIKKNIYINLYKMQMKCSK